MKRMEYGVPRNSMRVYRIWKFMRQRCRRPSGGNKRWYKGIKVCPEWEDFETFRLWAESHGYKDGLTIDRIDGTGNYCPGNCRWITMHDQQRNRRTNHPIDIGEKHFGTLTEAAEAFGLPRSYVSARIYLLGWSVEKALTTPAKKTSRRKQAI